MFLKQWVIFLPFDVELISTNRTWNNWCASLHFWLVSPPPPPSLPPLINDILHFIDCSVQKSGRFFPLCLVLHARCSPKGEFFTPILIWTLTSCLPGYEMSLLVWGCVGAVLVWACLIQTAADEGLRWPQHGCHDWGYFSIAVFVDSLGFWGSRTTGNKCHLNLKSVQCNQRYSHFSFFYF